MEWERLTEDQLDQVIVSAESGIAEWRAVEMAAIAEKRRRGSHHADGYRSIIDWVAARADVSHQTARSLTWTATRLVEVPEVAEDLAAGGISFDRAEQLARLPAAHRDGHEGFDIAQLRRKVAHHRRLTPKRERDHSNGFLNFQPSLDDTTTRIWGELPGLDSRTVEKAVDQRADELISGETSLSVAQRRAVALVAICQDALYTTEIPEDTSPIDVTVMVEARTAAPTDGEAGVSVLAGPRLGPSALQAVMCNAIVEVIGITEDSESLRLGRRSRTVPRRLRRHILHRDQGCTIDGCTSRYRLEVHHVTPWRYLGPTDPENLITLCWYHHHIAVHQEGLQVVRLSVSRVRLKRPR
jgi:hypothetical protein